MYTVISPRTKIITFETESLVYARILIRNTQQVIQYSPKAVKKYEEENK